MIKIIGINICDFQTVTNYTYIFLMTPTI